MAIVTLLATEVDGNTFASWTSPTVQIPAGSNKVLVVTVSLLDYHGDTIDNIKWTPTGGATQQMVFAIREQEGSTPFVAAQLWYLNIGDLAPDGVVEVMAGPSVLNRATISVQVVDGRNQGTPEALFSQSNALNIDVTTITDGAVAIAVLGSNANSGDGVVTAPWLAVSKLNAGSTGIRGVTGYVETATAGLTNYEVTGLGGNSFSALVAASFAPAAGGVSGAAAMTAPAASVSASGGLLVSGQASVTATPPDMVATGGLRIFGTAETVLPSIIAAATGKGVVNGAAAATVMPPSGAATGALRATGTMAGFIAAMTNSAAGKITVMGGAAGVIGATIVSQGTLNNRGSINATVAALIMAAAGAVPVEGISGSIAATIAAAMADSTGLIRVVGQASMDVAAMSAAAQGKQIVSGDIMAAFLPFIGQGAGVLEVTGQLDAVINALQAASSGVIGGIIGPPDSRTFIVGAQGANRTFIVGTQGRTFIVRD